MNINKTQENGIVTLTLDGKLNTANSHQFQELLIPAFEEANKVILDFAKLEYVASAGLRVLLTGYKTAGAKGAAMILRGVSDEIMQILEMTGFANFLDIE